MENRREGRIVREKEVQQTLFSAEVIMHETIAKFNEHKVDPATAALSMLFEGMNCLPQALPDVQLNALFMMEKSIAEHRARLAAEGHVLPEDERWPETFMDEAV